MVFVSLVTVSGCNQLVISPTKTSGDTVVIRGGLLLIKCEVYGLSLSLIPLVVEMVDRCAWQLVSLIYRQIILTASSPWSLLICC